MAERFNVQVIHVGCMATAEQMAFVKGYIARASEHINLVFSGSIETLLAYVMAFRDRLPREHFESARQS